MNPFLKRNWLKQSAGMALIEVMISVGIVGILALAMTSLTTDQIRQNKAMRETIGSISLERIMTTALANGSTCGYILNNPAVIILQLNKAIGVVDAAWDKFRANYSW